MRRVLELLRAFDAPNVFNPWQHDDPLDALAGGSAARAERLRAHFSCKPALLLLGEAPGYQGCHYSGVPFTNEKLIMGGSIPRVTSTFRLTTRELPWCEPSATIVWRTLHELGLAESTILWNAFAWHPFKPGEPLSNRTPTPQEVQLGLPALRAVLNYFEGVPIIPVGKVAGRTLEKLGIAALEPVRHPSMGGANLFREGMVSFARKRGAK
jgi:uracil-DNA glycosylase